jgi:arginase
MSDVRLIEVPYYLGREHADLSRGPGKLADAIGGDSVVIEQPLPSVLPNEIAESFAVIRSVAVTVRETVEEGRFPLVLAVNCFTSLGTVAGVGRDVGVVWFDAHGDFNTPDTTPTGFFDGMGLAMLLGDGWEELRQTVEGLRPVPAELAQALTAISSRFEIAAAAMTAYDPSVDPEGRIPPIAATLARQLVAERVAR